MISVLINVYHREDPEFFDVALKSLYDQTLKGFEVVLVVDGPVPQNIHEVITKWRQNFGGRMKCIYLEKNLGIAGAVNAGLRECSYDLVAKMDSDDYSLPSRLEIQYLFMDIHPEIDVLGTQMGEFESDPRDIHMIRQVPFTHEEIARTLWMKCPMNHVTVMYRRSSVLAVGGYDPSYGNDDFLWAKMIKAGYRFHNLQDCLVHARVGRNMKEMIRRRATLELFRWNCKIRTYLFRHRMISFGQYFLAMTVAAGIFLLPLDLKCYLFRKTRQHVG